MSPPLQFLVDSNLGLPVDEEPWRDILRRVGIATTSTNNLVALDRSVGRHEPDIVFMPIADFHRLLARGDDHYRGLVLVTSESTGAAALPSVLVVRRDDPAQGIGDLQGATLGYINTSCSSSYFAAAILLQRHGKNLRDFFDLRPTLPWQGQIDAVASATVRATMVVEDVWRSSAANAAHTKIIDRYDDATGAAVVVGDGVEESVLTTLLDELLAWRPQPGAIFGPFTPYRAADVARFFADMDRLPAGF